MRVPPKPAPEPGEWQTDKYGKRYRQVGSCIEYEPEINGIPQSVFFASQKAQKERDKARYEQERREAAERAAKQRNCPLKDGISTACSLEKCALYMDGCTLARLTDRPPAKATEGLQCPLSRYKSACRKDCALFKATGCTLTGIKTNTESEDK